MTALKKAIELKPDYDDAMAYLNLLYRQKADLESSSDCSRGRSQASGRSGGSGEGHQTEENARKRSNILIRVWFPGNVFQAGGPEGNAGFFFSCQPLLAIHCDRSNPGVEFPGPENHSSDRRLPARGTI